MFRLYSQLMIPVLVVRLIPLITLGTSSAG